MEPGSGTFSEMEIDIIGEILNISMGSAATAISTLLDKRVNITTPEVALVKATDIRITDLEPAIGVEITYVEGISGANIMVLKRADVNAIVNIMSGGMLGGSDDEELDEMSLSAICEVMNQMMGASATALSDFLGRTVNISTPKPVEVQPDEPFVKDNPNEEMVVVNFQLDIEDTVHSKFISVMTNELAREMVQTMTVMMTGGESEPPETIVAEKLAPIASQQPTVQVAPEPAPQQPVAAQPQQAVSQPQQERAMAPRAPKVVTKSSEVEYSQARPVELQSFDESVNFFMDDEIPENLNLIRSVPLEITVEIGKARKKVKEILEFVPGTVIELDKQAGAQVDVIVNGQPIAKGDVVVIGDNFGVRITEILKREELLKI